MTQPFDPVLIVEEFIFQTLKDDPTIDSLVGPDNIWPAFSPVDVAEMHLTHDFAGPDGGRPSVPQGQGLGMIELDWDITAWVEGEDRQILRPVMKAVMSRLTGAEIRGRMFQFESDDGSYWDVSVRYSGPVVVPADIGPGMTWQRVSARYAVTLRPIG